jgi:hypothetical protein
MAITLRIPLLVVLLTTVGCAHDVIPNTDVEDNADNREVLEFVEIYRQAMIDRDVGALLRLASQTYFDDNGTPGSADDVDYGALRQRLSIWGDEVLEVHYDMRYKRVTFLENEHILVDYKYSGRYKLMTIAGERWSRRLGDNRIVLGREEGAFRILSGM